LESASTVNDKQLHAELLKQEQQGFKPWRLRFRSALETVYRNQFAERYRKLNRVFVAVGALFMLLFGVADWLFLEQHFHVAVGIRLAAIFCGFMVWHWLSQPLKRNRAALLICALAYLNLVALLAIGYIAALQGHFHYQAGSIMVTLFLATMTRLNFHWILPTCLLMFGTQLTAMLAIVPTPQPQLLEQSFIFSLLTVIALVVNYRLEYESRLNFLRRLLLAQENKALAETKLKLELISITDELTGIYNRRYFNEQFQQRWNSAVRHHYWISLLMIDVDFFKRYNDTYGHLQGDEVLREVAQCFNLGSKRADEITARFGGEEFVVLLPHTQVSDAVQIGEHLRLLVEQLDREHRQSDMGKVTVSIGVAGMQPVQTDTSQTLIKQADEALYKAKAAGRNRVVSWQAER
jgi:diguanylate cyclase (GGDEF)-like protein